ncbi:hypothetical protein [Mesorhizobium sp.]|uniref:hypothetical protein n=1 Tax=Mesorhizobium sp. TaxID=1871066 RepID=UPI0025BF313D|nr:hypothetical protein [Mesorhizobium sp.]
MTNLAIEARLARLEAERDDQNVIFFPASLTSKRDDRAVARAMAGEQSLFEFRRQARAGQKAQLEERIAQLAEETSGSSEQRTAKSREIGN